MILDFFCERNLEIWLFSIQNLMEKVNGKAVQRIAVSL